MAPTSNGKTKNEGNKGLLELFIFTAALATGTACSILSKVMYNARDAQGQNFDKPLAQTFAMFSAMLVGLPIHYLIAWLKIPFPGYETWGTDDDEDEEEGFSNIEYATKSPAAVVDIDRTPPMKSHRMAAATQSHDQVEEGQCLLPAVPSRTKAANSSDDDSDYEVYLDNDRVPIKTYLQLFIPAFFDCTSTALFMVGLLFLDVSVYQLLRGSGIIFVALLREYGLKEHLFKYQWVGLWWNVVSALLVGAKALLDSGGDSETHPDASFEEALLGICFMMAGTLLQAMEFVLEEKFMVADEVKVPPLLFFGMKGFW
jgi:hypothetical protein